jgi:hypothetical protein
LVLFGAAQCHVDNASEVVHSDVVIQLGACRCRAVLNPGKRY